MKKYCPELWKVWGQSEFGFSMLRICESCMIISVLEQGESPENKYTGKSTLGGLHKTDANLRFLMFWDSGLYI